MPQFTDKVGIVEGIEIILKNSDYIAMEKEGGYRTWKIKGENIEAIATFKLDEAMGIWWEIASDKDTTTVLLSPNYEDTNDPRDYVIKSSTYRGIFKVYNDEPDCNSSFSLYEAAESPTLLTGVARLLMAVENSKPCDRGKWKIKTKESVPEPIQLAFLFSAIQSLNVRYMEHL